jgi:hypothetical protein
MDSIAAGNQGLPTGRADAARPCREAGAEGSRLKRRVMKTIIGRYWWRGE